MPVASGTWFAAQWLFILIVYGGDGWPAVCLQVVSSAVVESFFMCMLKADC